MAEDQDNMAAAARVDNATFHSFRVSGKWYATGRGVLSPKVFGVFERRDRRQVIVGDNGGKFPGLNSAGHEFIFVVFGDESLDHGYPLLLYPDDIGGIHP